MSPSPNTKAREKMIETSFFHYLVLKVNHPGVEKNFDGLPSKKQIFSMFSANMTNGIHEMCKFPIGVGYQGPLFPLNLMEHQYMLLAEKLESNEKLIQWEQDMYQQYNAEINENNCHSSTKYLFVSGA
jgi:hypothetical protein